MVDVPSLLLDGVAAFILYNVGVWVVLDFGQQFNLFSEDKLSLFVVKTNLFDALDIVFIIDDLVNDAVSGSDDLFEFEPFIELTISIQELHCFIVHRL